MTAILTPDEAKAFKMAARKGRMTLSAWVRLACEMLLIKQGHRGVRGIADAALRNRKPAARVRPRT